MAYDYDRALSYTLWLLGRRDYSERELRERLARKETPLADVERVIDRLRDLDLIDDAKVGALLVRSKQRKKGIFALRRALRRKGIEGETARKALEPVTDATQLAAARAILAKHAWRFEDRDSKARSRAFAFLARRGFPPDVAGAAVDATGWFDEP